jgi:hypothetical protein
MIVGRFETQRQALAVLDHPNIDPLLAGQLAYG